MVLPRIAWAILAVLCVFLLLEPWECRLFCVRDNATKRAQAKGNDALVIVEGGSSRAPPQLSWTKTRAVRVIEVDDLQNLTIVHKPSVDKRDLPIFSEKLYELLPPGCPSCELPPPPSWLPPGRTPHPNSSQLLQQFMNEDPVGRLEPSQQRRLLVVGDSFARYLADGITERISRFTSQPERKVDPVRAAWIDSHEFPLPHWKPSGSVAAKRAPALRFENSLYLNKDRHWDRKSTTRFEPTHVIVQRGIWDVTRITPHSPRRSFAQYVRGLVKARLEFPPHVRMFVYGLHALFSDNKYTGDLRNCTYIQEASMYRRTFYCAVRRANAVLAGLHEVNLTSFTASAWQEKADAAAKNTGLLEYYDSYSWTKYNINNDTYGGDGIHFSGSAMDKVIDGFLDLTLRSPAYPMPLMGTACATNLSFIQADETPCAPVFPTHDAWVARVIADLVSRMGNREVTLHRYLNESRLAEAPVWVSEDVTVSLQNAVDVISFAWCLQMNHFAYEYIGTIEASLSEVSPLKLREKRALETCQRRIDTQLVANSSSLLAFNAMAGAGYINVARTCFISALQTKAALDANAEYERPPNLFELCYEHGFPRYGSFDRAGSTGWRAHTNMTNETCSAFLSAAAHLPDGSLSVPLDPMVSLPVPINSSILTEFGIEESPTFASISRRCAAVVTHIVSNRTRECMNLFGDKETPDDGEEASDRNRRDCSSYLKGIGRSERSHLWLVSSCAALRQLHTLVEVRDQLLRGGCR